MGMFAIRFPENIYRRELMCMYSDLALGIASNQHGFYQLRLPEGEHRIAVSYLGYQTKSFKLDLDDHFILPLTLSPSADLPAVVVVDKHHTGQFPQDVYRDQRIPGTPA